MKTGIVKAFLLAAAFGLVQPVQAEPRAPKWLVLDKITYQKGVNACAFDGIDQLLLTKLVQAHKYKCLDRDAYETAAREEGFGGKADLVPAGYSMRGEIVQMLSSGKTRTIGGTSRAEYIATVSIRANDLRTQQPYEAETLRVAAYCQTPKDMLVFVVQRLSLAILMRDYPMYVMDYDDDEGEITLSYGSDFLNVGEQYEIRRRKAIVDDDTGDTVYKEKTVGVCEVTDVGKNTSEAKLVSGKAKEKDILRFYENADRFQVPSASVPDVGTGARASALPKRQPRIAVAPFISKSKTFSVWGLQIPARNWMDDIRGHLDTYLAQCGSFKVLDRTFGPEIDNELNRIVSDPNASPNDVCRLSQKLATDYLVVAEVMFSDVASPGTDFATGLPLPPPSAVFAEVRFRCVMAPTTQIAYAEVVGLDASKFGGTAEQFSSSSAYAAARDIVNLIQKHLDPAGFEAAQRASAQAVLKSQPAPVAPANPVPAQGVNLGF